MCLYRAYKPCSLADGSGAKVWAAVARVSFNTGLRESFDAATWAQQQTVNSLQESWAGLASRDQQPGHLTPALTPQLCCFDLSPHQLYCVLPTLPPNTDLGYSFACF